jgi:hypothetical protein
MFRGPKVDYVERLERYPGLILLSGRLPVGQLTEGLSSQFPACVLGRNTTVGRFELRDVSAADLVEITDFVSINGGLVRPAGHRKPITATAIWRGSRPDAARFSQLSLPYRMSVVDLQSGKWYVNEISAATEAVGAK